MSETPAQYAARVDRLTNDPRSIELSRHLTPAFTVKRAAGELWDALIEGEPEPDHEITVADVNRAAWEKAEETYRG